jgi:trk system potassium uptake protein TrkH
LSFDIRLIRKLSGLICLVAGGAMAPCAAIAFGCAEYPEMRIFLMLMGLLVAAGLALFFPVRRATHQIKLREGFFIVALCWILLSALAALPYFIGGHLPHYVDALFESVSSVTTTGANLIADVDALPRSLIFWRALLNWMGGLGILLFAISVLPAIGIGTANLANAETAGSNIEKYRLRISETARTAYLIYVGLSVLECALLLIGGLSPFDAVVNAFSSVSNSGLTGYSEGVSHFGNVGVEVIISVFCLVGAMNFSTLQLLPRGRVKEFFRDAEIRLYLIMVGSVFALIVTMLCVSGVYGSPAEAMRGSFLQVLSFTSTSGYSVTDYGSWPLFCKALLFFTAFVGGCSASTAGGIKMSRLAVMAKLIRRNIYKRLHPNAVVALKVGGNTVPEEKVSNISVFVIVYLLIFAGGVTLLSLEGFDMETTAGSVLAALSNTGLGFGGTGYGHGFEMFSHGGKFLLTLLMLIGRLEIFAIVMLFTPTFWRKDR